MSPLDQVTGQRLSGLVLDYVAAAMLKNDRDAEIVEAT